MTRVLLLYLLAITIGTSCSHNGGAGRCEPTPQNGGNWTFAVPSPNEFRLKDGVRVLVLERRDVSIVEIGAILPLGESGSSVEALPLVHSWRDRIASSPDTSRLLRALGSDIETAAGPNWIGLETTALEQDAQRSIQLMARNVAQVSFSAKGSQQLTKSEDSSLTFGPSDVAFSLVTGRPILDDRAANSDAVRVAANLEQLRVPAKLTFIVIGPVRAEDVRSWIEVELASWRPAVVPSVETAKTILFTPPTDVDGKIFVIDDPAAPNGTVDFYAGLPGPSLGSSAWPLAFAANTLLGDSSESRLRHASRTEGGYSYVFRSQLLWRSTKAAFWASQQISIQDAARAVADTQSAFRSMSSEPLSSAEWNRVRWLTVRNIARRSSTTSGALSMFEDVVGHDLPSNFFETVVAAVLGANLPSMQAYLSGAFSKLPAIALVGRADDILRVLHDAGLEAERVSR